MKYLKIFEDFERSAYTKISPKTLIKGNQYLQEKYSFLNVDLYEDVDVIPGGHFLYNETEYDSIENLIEGVHENAINIWDYRQFNYIINSGLIDVKGDVIINHMNLYKIPYKFGKVKGNFLCSHNQLITLEGAPHKVGGKFNCSQNKLTTLKGAPRTVGKDFYCIDNLLTTLEDGPHKVGSHFACGHNRLTTLKGAPRKVGLNFYCNNNQLTILKYLPKEIGGDIICYKNPNLTDFSGVRKDWKGKIQN